jgi:hypothetical protein
MNFFRQIKSHEQYENLKKDIMDNLHPNIALQTLSSLGFKSEERYSNQVGRQIRLCENVNEWARRLEQESKGNWPKIASEVRSEHYLCKYLDLIVNFVNRNPMILNKEDAKYFTPKDRSTADDEFKGQLKLYRVPPYRQQLLSGFNSLESYLSSFGSFRPIQSLYRQGGGFNISNVRAMQMMQASKTNKFAPRQYQVGGNYGEQYKFASAESKRTGYGLVQRLYDQVRADLKHRGKEIGETSKARINGILENYKKAEDEVTNGLIQLEKYLTLVQGFKDYEPKTLESDEIQKFITDHREMEEKFRRTQMKVFNIMHFLVRISNDNDKDQLTTAYASDLAAKRIPDERPSGMRGKLYDLV